VYRQSFVFLPRMEKSTQRGVLSSEVKADEVDKYIVFMKAKFMEHFSLKREGERPLARPI
jgi:hypothetical protein